MSFSQIQSTLYKLVVRDHNPAAAQRWINDHVPAELKPYAFGVLMSMFR